MRPTHIALLQMPEVQVESAWPAGVQYEIKTAEAESSAGNTTRDMSIYTDMMVILVACILM